MRKPLEVFAIKPIIAAEIKMPQVGKVAELMRNWAIKSIPTKCTPSHLQQSLELPQEETVAAVHPFPFATVFRTPPRRETTIIVDKIWFEVEESLSLPLYAPDCFSMICNS
ncbi:hypothetical protein RHGRI_014940 [Rhododendron griersonianum]|uniref:Uncharacterized protein n=1 Tax=Rhododendron griersonianum TaxID=479676 RepID=A0AAV6KBV2_9ERIC|nr:hypothetical protein RHGRI_014940 [Rhododendron griersonianum]